MDYERWKYFRQATNGVGLTATISNNFLNLCNSVVLVTMIYGVVVKDVDSSMSMGGRYAPCQATLGIIWT